MKNNINLTRYKELLKLKENGKIEILDKNFIELATIRLTIESQISYNRKKMYFLLIQNYLDGIISSYDFQSKFMEMMSEDSNTADLILKDFERLEGFILSKNLEKFSDLYMEITTLCQERYEIVNDNDDAGPMPESQFYSLVSNQYLQLQEIFPISFPNHLSYQNIIDRSFKILISIVGLGFLLILFTSSNIN